MIKKLFIALVIFFLNHLVIVAQTTIAFQGGEGTAADNWTFVPIANNSTSFPPGPGTYGTFYRSGTKSIRLAGAQPSNCTIGTNCATGTVGGEGCSPMNGKTLEFNPVNVSCFENVQLKAYTSSYLGSCSGAGFDNTDYLFYEIKLNGGVWQTIDTLQGDNNNTWTFSMSSIGGLNNPAPNPFVYNVPAGTTTFAFRIRGATNRSDEFYFVDDVSLTTTTTGYGGTAGFWTGKVNTNWNNPCNWFNAVVPTVTTNVVIPDTSINYCEVLAGNTADCNSLDIYDTLKVESATSTINVNFSMNIRPTGFLDMSGSSTIGGTMNIKGSWRNYRDDTFFEESGSRINWTGTASQTIIVDNGAKEVFSTMQVNKASGRLISNEDIWIDPFNERGNMSVLTLTNGIFDFKNYYKELTIGNRFSGAVTRTGGGVCLEDVQNRSKFTRAIDPAQGSYLFPICRYTTAALTTNQYIPITISNLTGGIGSVTLSSYNTPATNLPLPTSPVSVTNLASSIGLSPDNRDATADRFWNFTSSTPLSGSITFRYDSLEIPIPPYNDPVQLKAQSYDDNTDAWQPYLPGQSAGNYFVTVPSTPIDFTWTLTSTPSPLPVELLYFNAIPKNNREVRLVWETASEVNSWMFEIERSADGISFEKILSTPAAGNTSSSTNYTLVDVTPLTGTSYYRLLETDFDGQNQTSEPVRIDMDKFSVSNPMQVFPNPASNEIFVWGVDQSSFIELLDFKGSLVYRYAVEPSVPLTKLDLTGFPQGIYLLKDDYGNSQKLVIK